MFEFDCLCHLFHLQTQSVSIDINHNLKPHIVSWIINQRETNMEITIIKRHMLYQGFNNLNVIKIFQNHGGFKSYI
jgi:hypothetical protein